MATKVPSKFMFEGDIVAPQCHGCAHWNKGTRTCAAYPAGIPVGILTNVQDHKKPVEGDGGIHFEPIKPS